MGNKMEMSQRYEGTRQYSCLLKKIVFMYLKINDNV